MAEPKERADLYRGVSHRLQFLLLHVGGIVDESADELGLCVHETGFPPYLHAGPIREAEFIPAMAQGILDSGRALRARVVAAVQPAAWIRQGFPARPADRIVRVCHTGDADRHVEGPERSGPRLADLRMAVVPDDRLRPADDHQSGCRQAQMLIVDVDALQAVDFLNLVDQVLLQFLFTEHRQDVVRVARAVHERFAGLDLLAFLNLDMDAAGQRVYAFFAVIAYDGDLAQALADFAVFDRAVDLRHDGRLARLARFEQLHHARQTAGDVLGLGGFARDLGQHIAGVDFLAVANHQVGVGGHQVLLGLRTGPRSAFRPDHDLRLPLLVG